MLFAALRFYRDKNIRDRTYWYLSPFPVRAGERVFAPVGARNRLQKAVVERTTEAEKENAPYDIALLKKIEARCGVQRFSLGDSDYTDLGGIRYDDRHYTRFGCVSFCVKEALSAQEKTALTKIGFDGFLHLDGAVNEICDCKRVLVYGADARD